MNGKGQFTVELAPFFDPQVDMSRSITSKKLSSPPDMCPSLRRKTVVVVISQFGHIFSGKSRHRQKSLQRMHFAKVYDANEVSCDG